jgi:hypothetical protein
MPVLFNLAIYNVGDFVLKGYALRIFQVKVGQFFLELVVSLLAEMEPLIVEEKCALSQGESQEV